MEKKTELPDAGKLLIAVCSTGKHFNKSLQAVIRYAQNFMTIYKKDSVALFDKDYDRVIKGLTGSGFDTSKGFLIDGKPVYRAKKY